MLQVRLWRAGDAIVELSGSRVHMVDPILDRSFFAKIGDSRTPSSPGQPVTPMVLWQNATEPRRNGSLQSSPVRAPPACA